MEKPPQFLKDFSKKQSPDERQQAAEEIRAKRSEHFAQSKQEAERQTELQRRLAEIQALDTEIEELSTTKLAGIKNFFKLRGLKAELRQGTAATEALQKESETAVDSGGLEEARQMLDRFWVGQKDKWAEAPYDKQEMVELFDEKHLESLSLPDYALLLKRFPGEMVCHVTRHGIRDHVSHHDAGGDEYSDNFQKVLADGRLRSPLAIWLMEENKEAALAEFLRLDQQPDENEALLYLNDKVSPDRQSLPGSYADKTAIHFAVEAVASDYYGSENGNEIFFAFPSAQIASQYFFEGHHGVAGSEATNDMLWNDLFVWTQEEKGMSLNAGLVFIPRDTPVDKQTGSRYALDKDKRPILNQAHIDKVKEVINSPNFAEFAGAAVKILGKFNQDWTDEEMVDVPNEVARQDLEPYRRRLETDLGVTDRRLQRAILDYSLLHELSYAPERTDGAIEKNLRQQGIYFQAAADTVPAQEFWENYFASHPEQSPSKVVYYPEKNPTQGLYNWRRKQGLTKRSPKADMGFPEKEVPRYSPPAMAGRDRFYDLAREVIEKHYQMADIKK